MHPSSASADLPGIAYLAVLLRQNCFFIAIFSAELGGTTAHLRRLPRKGRAGGAKKSLLKHRVACSTRPAMHPSSASATATTAACGGNREELLGPRPARHEHRSRCEVDAGSRNPEELFLRLCFGRAVFCCLRSTEQSIQQSAPTPVLERGRFVCEVLQPEGCMRNRRLGHISQSVPAQSVRRCKQRDTGL